MDLQNTYYVMAIVFMCLMFTLLIVLLVAVFIIRAKVNAIHKSIDEKLTLVAEIAAPAIAAAKVVQEVKKSIGKK